MSDEKYLDLQGLKSYDKKIKDYIQTHGGEGGSMPTPTAKDKLLISNENLKWTEIDKDDIGGVSEEDRTKWDAKYSKPSTGIPASDLADGVIPTTLPASDVKDWAKADKKPTYTADEVGALADTVTHLSGDVPTTRKINNKALSSDITLTASDVDALPSTTTHLSGDIASSEKGAASGVATLGTDGKIPSSQLPSYVDDVLEYSAKASFPTTGESGKIYVDTSDNKTYRWSGSAYVEISPSVVIGTTTGTAFDGKSGKDHVDNTTVHITAAERTSWDNKQNEITSSNKLSADLISGLPTSLPASDVYEWAKADTKPTYTASEINAVSTNEDSNVSGAITFDGNDNYGIFTSTNNYGSIGSSSKYFYRSYVNNIYGSNIQLKGKTSTSKLAKIENTNNLSGTINLPSEAGTLATEEYVTNKIDELPQSSVATQSTDGLMSSTDKKKLDRTTLSLVPEGTVIPASTDINTTNYIKVGLYYCSANATVGTLTNCPTKNAFMMEVYSPLSTTYDNETDDQYVYRVRKILTYQGEEYTQSVSSGSTAGTFTYGDWRRTDTDTTYSNFVKSGSGAKAGLVPSPSTTAGTTKYLREDGTWVVPPNTTYSNFVKSGSGAKAGLVPAPSTTAGTTKYLREDGTWVVPPNTTYSSKSAASGGTDVSLVTTGEKATWNAKTSNTGTVTSVAVKMNGSTKGTVTSSGTIDLGTVITAHQSISGKLNTSGGTLTGDVTFNKNVSIKGTCYGMTYQDASTGTAMLFMGSKQIWLRQDTSCSVVNYANSGFKPILASQFSVQSSRLTKENIVNITDDEAKKILDLRPVSFDYKQKFGGEKGKFGLIAEETLDLIPSCVNVPEDYNEEEFDEEKGIQQSILSIDYSKLVPHLIKMVQIQQEEINELKAKIK